MRPTTCPKKMKKDLEKYGQDAFSMAEVTKTTSKNWANELERRHISLNDACKKGYNRLSGKPGGDLKLQAAQRAMAKKKVQEQVIDLT